jgi:hypothetical protein
MVQRTSEAVQFQGGQGMQVRDSALGNARPDFAKYSTTTELAALPNSESSASRLLDNIVGVAGKIAQQAVKNSQEEAYLTGAAKAGTIASEQELEGNVFTRQWAKAGYRDTMGRVAIAENESRIMRDMPKMREASPEAFNAYMAERRSELMPSLEGMSRQQRGAAFQNILLNERSSIKKHTTEHMAFQIETENRSIQGLIGVQHNNLDAAKSDIGTYKTATEAAFASYNSAIIQNPKLTLPLMSKLIAEGAEHALSSDHQPLYKMLKETQIPLPDGRTGSMLSLLPFDEQVKLGEVYRKSMVRTEGFRAQEFMVDQARMQASWDNPDTPLMPESEMLAKIADGAQRGFMNADQQRSFSLDYFKAAAKKAVQTDLASAYAAGDSTKLMGMNKTDEEGQAAWNATVGRKLDPAQRVAALTTIGIVQGRPAALNELGKQLAPGLAQIGLNDKIDPGNAQSLAQTMLTLDAAEKSGKSGVYEAVMSSYPEALRSKMLGIREGIRSGLDPVNAVAAAQRASVEEAKLSPQQRVAMGEAAAKDDIAFLKELDPRGLMTTLGLKAKSIFSGSAGNLAGVSTRVGWSENPERAAEVAASMKYAAVEELRSLGVAHPFMSADARRTAALSALSARTVVTADGPMVIPRGMTMQSFFGVPAETAKDRIGVALDEAIKPTEGNRIVYSVVEGNLMFKELNKAGQVARSGQFDPKQVAPMVKTQQDREVEEYKIMHGSGTTVSGVTFNGDNSSGLDNKSVYRMRAALLTNGTIKVSGAAAGNPAVNASFTQITDAAANASRLPMKTTGKQGQSAFELFSTFNIQTENKFTSMKSFRPLLQAMAGTDPVAAHAALVATPWYNKANPAEQAWAAIALNKVFKGL